jgi:hypothetical protein
MPTYLDCESAHAGLTKQVIFRMRQNVDGSEKHEYPEAHWRCALG